MYLRLVTLTFDPKINEFPELTVKPELIVKHFHVKFGDPSSISF